MSEELFSPASFFMVRSPIWPIQMSERFLEQDNWLEKLMDFYDSHELMRESILMASPSLYKSLNDSSVRKYKDNQPVKQYKKLGLSLLNYALRMATRGTPFGLFSFVSVGGWAPQTFLEVNLEKIRKRTRPDMEWTSAFIRKFYYDSQHFSWLPVYLNPLVQRCGDRFLLTYMTQMDKEISKSSKTSSIKSGQLIELIFSYAKRPIVANALVEKIKVDLSHADEEKVEDLIQKLLLSQFLMADILPPLLSSAPFEDLIDRLPAKSNLQKVVHQINLYDQNPLGTGEKQLSQLQQEMKNEVEAPFCLQSDSYYTDQHLSLHPAVGKELGKAVSFLWRLGALTQRLPGLDSYHRKFTEKYGYARTIPLLELLSEEKGLGPSYKSDSAIQSSPSAFTKLWEQWLENAWQETVHQQTQEIVLTESLIENLLNLSQEKAPNPQDALNSIDVFFKLVGVSPKAIDQGDFTLQYCQSAWQGTSTFGRFLDMVEPETQAQVCQFIQKEEQLEPRSLFVELCYFPKSMRYANIATYPCFRSYRLDLTSQKHDENMLTLEDIYVGATSHRFYLTLKTGGVELNACSDSMINASIAPEAFQFMYDVSLTKYKPLYNFLWGIREETSNFLPRIRFKKTILSPAKWNIHGELFRKKSLEKAKEEFNTWADKWSLPQRCLMRRHYDQYLLIDRTHAAHLEQIVCKLLKGESLQFIEQIEDSVIKSPEGSHSTEIIIPFLKNPVYAKNATLYSPPPYISTSVETRWRFPGQEWLYLKFYLSPELEDYFLLNYLAPFTDNICQNLNNLWFFIRYSDPEPHIRLRIKVDSPKAFSEIISSFEPMYGKWMREGLIKDVILASYEREIERYGGLSLIDKAEFFFCSDTRATINWLTSIRGRTSYPKPVLNGLSLINLLKNFDLSPEEMLSILNDAYHDEKQYIKRASSYKNDLSFLLATLEDQTEKQLPFEIETLKTVSQVRLQSSNIFSAQAKQSGLSKITLWNIYRTLLHMHCNRLGGTLEDEKEAILCMRDALLQLKWQRESRSNRGKRALSF
jgi:thiopeptide-type bacteriocin biosynthesis protein